MKISFTLKDHFDRTPEQLYNAWLDSDEHSSMTGATAKCSKLEGGRFSAWDGYISGKNISLNPFTEIVQSWRTTDFEESDKDSKLTVRFKAYAKGCKLEIVHENIPEVDADFEKGWQEYYFKPMLDYFSSH